MVGKFLNESIDISISKQFVLSEIDLSSFKIQETLNPVFFDEDENMKEDIREQLLKIGKDFYEYLDVDWVRMRDIILTGSLANYNWSKFSDVDLHVVIPYKKVSSNEDLVEDLMWGKKELWNRDHDIEIYDYPVELYAQNSSDKLVAGGVYSVLHDKWIIKPERIKVNYNENLIDQLVSDIQGKFENLLRKFIAGNTFGIVDDISDLKDQIKKYREEGLSGGGEFDDRNIAFKALRRMGVMDKLDDLRSIAYDGDMSISSLEKKVDDEKVFDPKKSSGDESGKEDEKKPIKKGLGRYSINGRRFVSLRDAEKRLGVPKSTIEYRVKSEDPKFSAYRVLPI